MTEQELEDLKQGIIRATIEIAGFGGKTTRHLPDDFVAGNGLILRREEDGQWWIWQMVEPLFKVGDRIRAKGTTGDGATIKTIDEETGCYVWGNGVKGSYVNVEYELAPYEPKDGDIVKRKGDDSGTRHQIFDNKERELGGNDFIIMQIMEHGAGGGSISRHQLTQEYDLVERRQTFDNSLSTLTEKMMRLHQQKKVVDVTIEGVTHRLVVDPPHENCKECSLDKVCDRCKNALCDILAGRADEAHIFQADPTPLSWDELPKDKSLLSHRFARDYQITISADSQDRPYWSLLRKGEPCHHPSRDEYEVLAAMLDDVRKKIQRVLDKEP